MATPTAPMSPVESPPTAKRPPSSFHPLVCVVDFNHSRGPEIEHWIGAAPGSDPVADNDWHLIPYMALPDGAHQSDEDFSYFSVVWHGGDGYGGVARQPPTSVFGISCMRQVDSAELVYRPQQVTRSAVQKAVVAITDQPQGFGALREKLSAVTRAWFAQRDFRDIEILQRFQESLVSVGDGLGDERDQYFGISLRQLIHTFKWHTLVLLKSLLLQPKILFYGTQCERLCQVQFALISLIPGLVRSLYDCADPLMDRDAETRRKPDAVRTSDRSSLLAYVGLPLQLFGKGALFGPYTPLQQLDAIAEHRTQSYVVGSTNGLLLQQRERYCDMIVNMDDNTVSIISPTLKAPLALTVADRRWVGFLTQAVNDTWDEADPSTPTTHGYAGSEEFIRLQFEEYLIALLSSTKYHQYLATHREGDPKALLADVDGDPAAEFSLAYIEAWQQSENYRLWDRTTDPQLFDVLEPRHPCAGGLTVEDVQRRLAAQVAELHLDERLSQTREVVGKRLADGRVQVTSAFNRVWADIEVMREQQRKRAEERGPPPEPKPPALSSANLHQAQATVAAASQRAGAYLSSWSSWASEKRKTGWGGRPTAADALAASASQGLPNRPPVTAVSELTKAANVPDVVVTRATSTNKEANTPPPRR